MTTTRFAATVALVIICALPRVGFPQARSEFAAITGKAVDEQGGVLPGVTVHARNPETNLSRSAVTEADGTFRLLALPPGPYIVTAELQGFSKSEQRLTLTVGQEAQLTVKMAIGTLEENVTVTGEAPLIEVGKSSVGATLAETQVRSLPLQSRNFNELALLTPGASGHAGGSTPAFSGQRAEFNSVLVDGFDNMYQGISQADRNIFSQEAIQEFRTLSNSFAPEYGKAAGGVVTAVSKSGTNTVKGSAFGFFRNDSMVKPNYFLRGRPIAPFSQQRFGATTGGPLQKDKLFFFIAHEQQVLAQPVDYVLDATLAPLFGIPARGSYKSKSGRGMTSLKLDANLSQKNTVSIRVNYMRDKGDAGAGWYNGTGFMGGTGNDDSDLGLAFRLNTFLSERKLNEVRASVSRVYRGEKYFQSEHPGPLGPQPTVRIGGSNFGQGQGKSNSTYRQHYLNVADTMSIYKDNHELKFGAEYQSNISYENSGYFWNGIFYFADRTAFNRGLPFAFEKAFMAQGGQPEINYTDHQFHFFAQDTITRNRLTINYGTRYDLEYYPTSISGGDPNYVVNSDFTNVGPRAGITYKIDDATQIRAGGGLFWGRLPDEAFLQTGLFKPGRDPWYTTNQAGAIELWQKFGINTPVTFAGLPAGTLPEDHRIVSDPRMPLSIQASAGIDRELTPTIALHVSFLHASGQNATRAENLNIDVSKGARIPAGQVIPGPLRYVAPYDIFWYPDTATLNPAYNRSWQYLTNGRTKYDGLVFSVEKRMSKGIQVQGSYTYSRTWDDRDQWSFNRAAAFPENRAAEWSLSTTHRPHRAVMSAVWASPFKNILARAWNLSAIGVFQSQNAEETKSNIDFNNDGSPMDRPPDRMRTIRFHDSFYKNIDVHASRTFSLGGRVKLEAIAEGFNVFNFVNYQTHRVVGFMYTTRADAATGNTLVLPDTTNYGTPATAYPAAQAQLAFRLIF